MKSLLPIVTILMLSNSTFAESYTCVGEKASGFEYSKLFKSWSPEEFKAGHVYYVRRPVKEDGLYPSKPKFVVEGPIHVLEKKTNTMLVGHCEKDFSEYGFLNCKYVTSTFKMNKETMRFMYQVHHGYMESKKTLESFERADIDGMIYLEIGNCEKTL